MSEFRTNIIEKFSYLSEFYSGFDLKVCLLLHENKRNWRLVYGEIWPTSSAPVIINIKEEIVVDHESLKIIHFTCPNSEFENIINSILRNKAYIINNYHIHFLGFDDHYTIADDISSEKSLEKYGFAWPMSVYLISGGISNIKNMGFPTNLDHELKMHPSGPYLDLLSALAPSFKDFPSIDSNPQLKIFFPNFFGRINSVEINGKNIKIETLLNKKLSSKKVEIGIIPGNKYKGEWLLLDEFNKFDESFIKNTKFVPFEKIKKYVIYLKIREMNFFDEAIIFNNEFTENVLLHTINHFDNSNFIEEALFKQTKKEEIDFEWAIISLLSSFGLSQIWLDYGLRRPNLPDILSYDNKSRKLFICECTTKEPGPEKISKLYSRAEDLKLLGLEDVEIINIFFVKRGAIPPDLLKSCKENGTIIFSGKEIRVIYQMALENKSSLELINYFNTCPLFVNF